VGIVSRTKARAAILCCATTELVLEENVGPVPVRGGRRGNSTPFWRRNTLATATFATFRRVPWSRRDRLMRRDSPTKFQPQSVSTGTPLRFVAMMGPAPRVDAAVEFATSPAAAAVEAAIEPHGVFLFGRGRRYTPVLALDVSRDERAASSRDPADGARPAGNPGAFCGHLSAHVQSSLLAAWRRGEIVMPS